jgi:hypothetical protein
VLDFDPSDPRKAQVLERWFTAISPYLRDRYGTGGDLNVDEVTEVIPLIQSLGWSTHRRAWCAATSARRPRLPASSTV